MSKVVDNLNRPVAEGGILITLRADATGGVSLGGDDSIEPGETRRVAAHIALPLLQNGRAVRAVVDVATESGSAPVDASGEPGNSPTPLVATTKPKRGK